MKGPFSARRDVYILEITPQEISIRAGAEQGIFYGIQSLRQLLPQGNALRQIPCQYIEDGPRFVWRGFMLDEGRHFQGMETVKDLLDVMALLKMNIFHWHLCERPGLADRDQTLPGADPNRRPAPGHGPQPAGCTAQTP